MADKSSKSRASGRCLIVAEISANHGQDYARAVELIKSARRCGVDAVKFQAYTPDTMTIDCENECFLVDHPYWGGQSLYELYKRAYTPWEWFKDLKTLTEDAGMMFLCTAFDSTSVDMLEELNICAHKIASFELVDLKLIEYAASTSKPLIMSTGMADDSEISDAVEAAKKSGSKDITLLKCISSYPAQAKEMNLRTIADMKERFNCPVGFSDHSLGNAAAMAAVTLGAEVIEKHFTLSRLDSTPDSFFSMEPDELILLVNEIRFVEKAIGRVWYGVTEGEQGSIAFRRSLFAVKDIKAGEEFSDENIKAIRPGYGLKPKLLSEVLGKTANVSIKKGQPLKWEMVDG